MTLRILDRLLLAVAALVALGTLAGLGFFAAALIAGEPLQTTLAMRWHDPQIYEIATRGGAAAGRLAVDGATLQVSAGGAAYRFAQLLDILAVGGGWLFVVLTVRKLARNIAAGTPFAASAVRNLRLVGWTLIALNAWAWMRITLAPLMLLGDLSVTGGVALHPALARNFTAPAAQVDAHLSLTLLICGLIVLALAEAFRIGRELATENEGFV